MAQSSSSPSWCGIDGVSYSKKGLKMLNNSWQLLAGAIAAASKVSIRETNDFLEKTLSRDSPMRPCVDEYMQFADTCQPLQLSKKAHMKYADDPKWQSAREDDFPPVLDDASDSEITEKDLPFLKTLWHSIQCMKALPSLFKKSQVKKSPYTFDLLDLVHIGAFLTKCDRSFKGKRIDEELQKIMKARTGTLTPEYAEPTTNGSSSNGPQLPHFSGSPEACRQQLLGIRALEMRDGHFRQQIASASAPQAQEKSIQKVMAEVQKSIRKKQKKDRQNNLKSESTSQNAIPEKHQMILVEELIDCDDVFADCILFEPADTEPHQNDTAVAQTVSINEAVATANDEGDENDESSQEATQDSASGAFTVQTISAITKSFPEACQKAGLRIVGDHASIRTPGGNRISLEKWQATGVEWMLHQEESPIHGGILADGCGLGKTRQAYTLIYQTSLNLPQRPRSFAELGRFEPTLVLCPKGLIDMWYAEGSELFGHDLTIKVFYGSKPNNASTEREKCIIGKTDELVDFLSTLNFRDRATSRIVIISSYDTFFKRTTSNKRGNTPPSHHSSEAINQNETGEEAPNPSTMKIEGDDYDLDSDQQQPSENSKGKNTPTGNTEPISDSSRNTFLRFQNGGQFVRQSTEYSSVLREKLAKRGLSGFRFARVICDEGHRVKTISSGAHQSIALLDYRAIWLLTATPMPNGIPDMFGLLSLFYRSAESLQSTELSPPPGSTSSITDDTGQAKFEIYAAWSKVKEMPSRMPYELLNPNLLAELAAQGLLNAVGASQILPIIFRLCILHREMGQIIQEQGSSFRIGAEIPPIRVMTIELCYSDRAQRQHDLFYNQDVKGLTVKGEDYSNPDAVIRMHYSSPATKLPQSSATGSGQINRKKLRRLCCAAFHPKLNIFLDNEGLIDHEDRPVDYFEKLLSAGDMGFTLFWERNNLDPANLPPRFQFDQAWYLLQESPRLRYLVKIFHDEGLTPPTKSPRFVIMCNWPMTVWLVQMLLNILGIDFEAITSDMEIKDRTASIERFNNPKEPCRAFVTTYDLGAHGLNIQYCCSRMVLMEPAINYSKMLHAIGRMHRLGQTQPQKVWYLFQDSTIQRWMDWNNTRKMRAQITAQNRQSFEKRADDLRDERLRQGFPVVNAQKEREDDMNTLADEFLRNVMGQGTGCANRKAMEDETNLDLIIDNDKGLYHCRRFGRHHLEIQKQKKQLELEEQQQKSAAHKRLAETENGEQDGQRFKKPFIELDD